MYDIVRFDKNCWLFMELKKSHFFSLKIFCFIFSSFFFMPISSVLILFVFTFKLSAYFIANLTYLLEIIQREMIGSILIIIMLMLEIRLEYLFILSKPSEIKYQNLNDSILFFSSQYYRLIY